MEKVLVLLSTYNGSDYLKELMESVLGQKHVEVSILARDDGSKDGTIEYLKAMQDSRINFIKGENKKAAGSFLELVEKAPDEYQYYAFCDQDDVWLEEKLSAAIKRLSIFPQNEPALYYSGQIITDRNLNILYEHILAADRSIKANCIFNQMAGCTAVFNRNLLMKLKEYTPDGIYGHDVWCYRVCAALNGHIVVESRGHIYYRQHGRNVVGMQSGLRGKLKNAKDYIFKYNASTYAEQILKGYGGQLSDDWKKFLKMICDSNHSIKSKWSMLSDSEVNFRSGKLRAVYIAKIILGKM